MGGGSGGRRRSGKHYPTHDSVSTIRKLVPCGNRLSFLHQGSASKAGGSSKNERCRPLNAFRYTYPEASAATSGDVDGPRSPIFLSSAGETIAAFVDRDAYPKLAVGVPSYEDDPSFVPGAGLGYCANDGEDEEEEEAEVVESGGGDEMDGSDAYSTPVIKKGSFLTIGGVKVYTEDISSPDEGDDGMNSNSDESNSSYSEEEEEEGEEEEEDEEDEGSSDGSLDVDFGSDIDKELAEDYLEGIGGSSELLNAEWLTAVKLDESDEDGFRRSDGRAKGGGGDKLGGGALLNASKEYGLKRPSYRKDKSVMKPRKFGSTDVDIDVSGLDDLLFVKDSRTSSGKKKKKKQKQQPPYLSRSWPGEARKGRKYDNFPGAKKKHRKELIAAKRRQRMINRGVDLEQINKKLREMVINDVDMVSFHPMHSRDCSQVQRLASIYQLLSGCRGSGKKRFVTVTRTEQTSLPSSKDKDRLDKLLGVGAEDEDFVVSSGNMTKLRTKAGRRFNSNLGSNPRVEAYQSAQSKLAKSSNASGKKKQAAKRQSYAEKPVSFVSCGIMQVDSAEEMMTVDSIERKVAVESAESSSSKLGAFEMHTKGFGSRMLAKMGFVEGSGLGKSGQGMVNPIEVIKRPKSLGLGIEFAEATSVEVKVEKAWGIGAFEKHTKGFGSRMMAKMGFIPGSGLGKDAQGIVTPLAAVRRPRCRGLGAT